MVLKRGGRQSFRVVRVPCCWSRRPWQYHAVVLCPNLALCQQVMTAVHGLVDAAGAPLLTAALVSERGTHASFATPAPLLHPAGGADAA